MGGPGPDKSVRRVLNVASPLSTDPCPLPSFKVAYGKDPREATPRHHCPDRTLRNLRRGDACWPGECGNQCQAARDAAGQETGSEEAGSKEARDEEGSGKACAEEGSQARACRLRKEGRCAQDRASQDQAGQACRQT